MTHYSSVGTEPTAPRALSRTTLPPLISGLAQLRIALADKRALMSRIESEWVAAAEAEAAKHLPKHVRINDRSTWDRATYRKYLAEAERIEPEFKLRVKRLLTEINALERLISPSTIHVSRRVA